VLPLAANADPLNEPNAFSAPAALTPSEIASRYDVRQQTVSKAILKYVRNLPALAADDLRRLEAERLDALTAALAPAIAKGDPRSIEARWNSGFDAPCNR
jgi:hypothetical protein